MTSQMNGIKLFFFWVFHPSASSSLWAKTSIPLGFGLYKIFFIRRRIFFLYTFRSRVVFPHITLSFIPWMYVLQYIHWMRHKDKKKRRNKTPEKKNSRRIYKDVFIVVILLWHKSNKKKTKKNKKKLCKKNVREKRRKGDQQKIYVVQHPFLYLYAYVIPLVSQLLLMVLNRVGWWWRRMDKNEGFHWKIDDWC